MLGLEIRSIIPIFTPNASSTGRVFLGFDFGAFFGFPEGDASLLGATGTVSVGYALPLGSVFLLPRLGISSQLLYLFGSSTLSPGSNSISYYSLDLAFRGLAGIGLLIPANGRARWLFGADAQFGADALLNVSVGIIF